MVRAAIKGVLAHKVRLGLTALAIVLGVSLVSGTFIFTDTINRQFDTLLDDIFAGIDVTVRKATGDFTDAEEPFSASVFEDITATDGVRVAEGGVSTLTAQILDAEGEPIGGQGPPTLGFSWGEVEALNPLRIKEGAGRAPAAPGEVGIDANTVENNDFALGDMVTVVTQSGPEEFELVGVMSFGDSDSLLGATLTAFEIDEARRLFGFGDEYTSISVVAAEGVAAEDLITRIEVVLPAELEAVTGQTQQDEEVDAISEGVGFITIGLLAFAGVSIFVGAFIIQNTFRIIVAQRTRELALMRAIGATARQVTWMVIVEAVIVGFVASVVGIAFGFGLAVAIRALLNAVGLGIPAASLILLPRTIIVGLVVGMVLTVVSAALPARRASRVPPVAAMREELATPKRRTLRKRAIAGSGVTGAGILALLVGLFGGVSNGIAIVGLGAAVTFVGVSILAPLAARPVADLIGRPVARVYGVSGVLARENTKRKPRRTASTASALMIGVALVAFFTIFAASTKASVEETIFELFPADLTVQSTNQSDPELPASFSPAFTDEIRDLDELETVSALQFGRVEILGTTELIGGIDPDTIGQVFALEPEGDALAALDTPNTILVSRSTADTLGWAVGQSIDVEYASTGIVPTEIAGIYGADDFTDFYLSSDTFAANFTVQGDGVVFANAADGFTLQQAQERVEDVAVPFGNVKVQSKSELVTEAEGQIDQALALFNGLLFFAVVIAVLGITNTLALSIYERTREIGLLRAVGMVRRQVRRMVRWEAVIIALFGAILGVVIGIFFGWSVIKALEDEGFGAFAIPYGQVVLALFMAGFAGVLAAIWPARKAARLNILEAISYE
ncbi:MAG: ABC transporter permease [Acidimicrobiia bacterium]